MSIQGRVQLKWYQLGIVFIRDGVSIHDGVSIREGVHLRGCPYGIVFTLDHVHSR